MANFKNKQVVKSLKMKKKLSNNEIQSKLTFNKNLNNISNVLISKPLLMPISDASLVDSKKKATSSITSNLTLIFIFI